MFTISGPNPILNLLLTLKEIDFLRFIRLVTIHLEMFPESAGEKKLFLCSQLNIFRKNIFIISSPGEVIQEVMTILIQITVDFMLRPPGLYREELILKPNYMFQSSTSSSRKMKTKIKLNVSQTMILKKGSGSPKIKYVYNCHNDISIFKSSWDIETEVKVTNI